MSLFCRVRHEDDVVQLVKADATNWGVEDPLDLLEGIRKGWIFYTEAWDHVLQPIWRMHVGRSSGNLTENSPLLDEAGRQPHCWRERRSGQGRPHIYLPGKPGDPRERTEGFVAHRWVQAQLVNLGLDLGEKAEMEVTIPRRPKDRENAMALPPAAPDIQRRRSIIDVAWFGSKIAWEVDLTQPTLSEQQIRATLRKEAGFDMIAVQDSAEAKESALSVPTMTVYKLKQAANKRQDARYPFKQMFVDSAVELDPTVQHAHWRERRGLRIEPFCRQRKRKQWYYATFRRESTPVFYSWVQHREVDAFKAKQAAHEAELEKARLTAEATRAQEVLEAAEKAVCERSTALKTADTARGNLVALKEELEGFDPADGGRRANFAQSRASRPKASDDLQSALTRLENLIDNHENGGPFWRTLDRVFGFMSRAKERKAAVLEILEGQLAESRERVERQTAKVKEAEAHLAALKQCRRQPRSDPF